VELASLALTRGRDRAVLDLCSQRSLESVKLLFSTLLARWRIKGALFWKGPIQAVRFDNYAWVGDETHRLD